MASQLTDSFAIPNLFLAKVELFDMLIDDEDEAGGYGGDTSDPETKSDDKSENTADADADQKDSETRGESVGTKAQGLNQSASSDVDEPNTNLSPQPPVSSPPQTDVDGSDSPSPARFQSSAD